ncbi:protein arginine kinase activator [Sedimentibacter acidaminivorans]|jgi:protein arginine kinase activator|uniref:Protein arginine kinase activator n=1 Tax=Sedimentibacter acidaminivorans TaxID=913099 RepID=A0ABS4GAF3_9FIRM|nr:UvrB/UvrC motif-containing protein [Sedimentibacter acidaminivorans]MBP1924659.1 protein arginine kinase activator [Sedimentibacter acidaminivorans]
MLCNECGKNEASVHVTHIINGKKTENHLCEDCARKNQSILNSTFSMENLFSAMLNNAFNGATYLPSKGCSTCGMTYDEFRNMGKFGCSHCIETFKPKLMPVVKNIQGYDIHQGKIPMRAGGDYKVQKDIEKLKLQLKQMIEQEEYEKAAQIRDKIRDMENKS